MVMLIRCGSHQVISILFVRCCHLLKSGEVAVVNSTFVVCCDVAVMVIGKVPRMLNCMCRVLKLLAESCLVRLSSYTSSGSFRCKWLQRNGRHRRQHAGSAIVSAMHFDLGN
jgi:hypothetical protein